MKRLGIIGGLGPMATAYFLRMIVEMTDAKTDQEHIEVLLHSKPQIPDRTRYILGLSEDSPMPHFQEVGKQLVGQGADVIVIPCITAHFFQEQLEHDIACPIIHAIEETAKYLQAENIRQVGVMATDGTIESRLFPQILEKYGITCIAPEADGQKKVMHIIYNNVKQGLPIEMNQFEAVSKELFDKGAQVILLGCTELSMAKRDHVLGAGYLDVMEVLARQAVLTCGNLKPEYEHLITK